MILIFIITMGFPCGPAGKESTSSAGDLGSIPGLGRCPGEGKGCPLQYSGLENSTDCIVHGVTELNTTERLSRAVRGTAFCIRLRHKSPSRVLFFISGYGGSVSEEPACSAGDPSPILRWGRFPTVGNGDPRQFSCLEDHTDRRAWWAIVLGVAKN